VSEDVAYAALPDCEGSRR